MSTNCFFFLSVAFVLFANLMMAEDLQGADTVTQQQLQGAIESKTLEENTIIGIEGSVLNRGRDCWNPCNRKGGKCPYCGSGSCCRIGYTGGDCNGKVGARNFHTCVTSPRPREVQNQGKDCWTPCNRKGGKCAYCGSRGSCCRIGWTGGDCNGKIGARNFHTCVRSPPRDVQNQGKDCWTPCNRKGGKCAYCGNRGSCCRIGWTGGDCNGKIGAPNFHTCVKSPPPPTVQNRGKDCWHPCRRTNGKCGYCGTGGSCCRMGWRGGDCDGTVGASGFHTCVASSNIRNVGKNCWTPCKSKGGRCDWCGPDGACCRQRWRDGPTCNRHAGAKNFHTCTRAAGTARVPVATAASSEEHMDEWITASVAVAGLSVVGVAGGLYWMTNKYRANPNQYQTILDDTQL